MLRRAAREITARRSMTRNVITRNSITTDNNNDSNNNILASSASQYLLKPTPSSSSNQQQQHQQQQRREYAKKSQPKGYTAPAAMAQRQQTQISAFPLSSGQIAEPWRGGRKWQRTVSDLPSWLYNLGLCKVKDLYATSKVSQAIKGFDLNEFKKESAQLYQEISRSIAMNSLGQCRHDVSDRVMTELKAEQKRRTKNGWVKLRWSLGEKGVEKVSVMQCRLVATSQDMNNAFAQFTVRFESRQEFGAYDEDDKLVAGDPEELGANLHVVDYWVFERALRSGAQNSSQQRWRLAGRLTV